MSSAANNFWSGRLAVISAKRASVWSRWMCQPALHRAFRCEFAVLDSVYKETSGFGNVTVHIIPQFDIQAGGRYSKNEQVATESLSGLLATPPISFSTPSSDMSDVFGGAAARISTTTTCCISAGRRARPGGPKPCRRALRLMCRAVRRRQDHQLRTPESSRPCSMGCCPSMPRCSTSTNIQLLEIVDARRQRQWRQGAEPGHRMDCGLCTGPA